MKQQFGMKPLKKRIQIAINGKKKKFKSSQGSSKNSYANTTSTSKDYKRKPPLESDSPLSDTIIDRSQREFSFAIMDTVVRIYYADLTDSLLNKNKEILKLFVARVGVNHISEISLTDFYSLDGFTDISIKSDIEKYILGIGVSKHRLFWRRNKQIKLKNDEKKTKKLLYLEIRFH